MYKLLLLFLTFIMIIPIQLNIFGMILKITLLANTVMGILGVIYYLRTKKIKKLEINIIIYLCILLVYVTINSMLHDFIDTQLINMMIFAIIIFIAFMLLGRMYKYIYKESFDIELLKSLVIVGIIHSFFMIFSLIDPYSFYSVVNISEGTKYHVYTGLRTTGLFYENFAIISVFYALLFIISLIVFSSIKRFLYMLIVSTLLLFSIGLVGRSGLIIVILGIILLITVSYFYKDLILKNYLFKYIFLYIFIFIFFILNFSTLANDNLEWVFEPFIKLVTEGKLQSESTDILFGEMYFLPKKAIDSIFGIGTFNLITIGSDSGYILFLHGGGIVGSIIFFSIYFYFIYIFYRYSQNTKIKFIGLFLIFTIMIGNIKDMYYFNYAGGFVALLFIVISILILQYENKNTIIFKAIK